MPKIIDEARARILSTARRKLFAEGYSGLTLRSVAGECSIAVGTIYNYFKDKDTLVASVMMEDWLEVLGRMDQACAQAQAAADGLVGIQQAIKSFGELYAPVWDQFSQTGGSSGTVSSRHHMLREQIVQRILGMMERLGMEDRVLAPILVETVLAAALQPDIGEEEIRILAERLR